jgi:hypothetical protein
MIGRVLFFLCIAVTTVANAEGVDCLFSGSIFKMDARSHGNLAIELRQVVTNNPEAVCKTLDVNSVLAGMRIPHAKVKVGDKVKLKFNCASSEICTLSSINPVPKDEKTKCADASGEWGTWTKHDAVIKNETCRIKAKDAQQPCLDGKDCSTGKCEYDSQAETGFCSEYGSSEGCHIWMKEGTAQNKVCVD